MTDTRYFTNTTGRSSKFWDIKVFPGLMYEVRFGRIGTMGSLRTKNFQTQTSKHLAVRKIIAEKTLNGYVEHDSHCNGYDEERSAYSPPSSGVEELSAQLRDEAVVALARSEGLETLESPGARAYTRARLTAGLGARADSTIIREGTAHEWTYKESTMSYWCARCHSAVGMHQVQNASDQAELDALLGRHCQGMPLRYSDPAPEPVEPVDPDPGRMISFDEEK